MDVVHRQTHSFFRYWGKARPASPDGPSWHPFAYHSLDVTAVATEWWGASKAIRRAFEGAFGAVDDDSSRKLRAWVLFFVALHDLGKLDVRFQLKARDVLNECWPELTLTDVDTSDRHANSYSHGDAGCSWFKKEYRAYFGMEDDGTALDTWLPWMAAVAGHHGEIVNDYDVGRPRAAPHVIRHDTDARREWVHTIAELFLGEEGLSLRDLPPACGTAAQHLLAGFCAVADWLGSNQEVFGYLTERQPLSNYLEKRLTLIREQQFLLRSGLTRREADYHGISSVLPPDETPRGVQVLVDTLPEAGLLLIEAPTGSGKTEAALAYAWRLVVAGLADSIVFALPTQASANAMLSRVEKFAEKLFMGGGANVVLAHGKREYNPEFRRLVDVGQIVTAQRGEDASAQCAGWLAQSRKRAFLGQIGICTVDQTLLSVLPVRHKFVRGFGLNKSVLIVDEVHAYDSYMHGLLNEVLRRQHATNGRAILLSATLPFDQRKRLFEAWGASTVGMSGAYPLLTYAGPDRVEEIELRPEDQPEDRVVEIECIAFPDALPDQGVIGRIITAAQAGARVAVVCNLVDVAQQLARSLRDCASVPVDIFHARYRFEDRQIKERAVLDLYGKDASRESGRVLVSTQVVEQSVDLDFDWMVTQICPVDLLFQRMGRLHRHERRRPRGFDTPHCLVLTPEGDDYGLHKLIYGNTRVLWRTEQLIRHAERGRILFPNAYREWIESVYQREDWSDEPERIALEYDSYHTVELHKRREAEELTRMTITQFRDEDAKAAALTRDGEMSLNVLPVIEGSRRDLLLDGTLLSTLDERVRGEVLNFNTIPVPASWKNRLRDCQRDDESRILLECSQDGDNGWIANVGTRGFRYTKDFGLEKTADESAD